MKAKLSSEERDQFCTTFIETMDLKQAEACIGRKDGAKLLGEPDVAARLKALREAGTPTRQDVLLRLGQLAFGKASDAAKLANRERDGSEQLDLSDVTELKITDRGTEMKLVNRVQVLEILWSLLDRGGERGVEQFLKALSQEDGDGESGT